MTLTQEIRDRKPEAQQHRRIFLYFLFIFFRELHLDLKVKLFCDFLQLPSLSEIIQCE